MAKEKTTTEKDTVVETQLNLDGTEWVAPIKRCDLFRRDDCGLLAGVEYVFRDNNTIDWRAMVNPEYTVINGQYKTELEQIHQKRFEELTPDDVDDKHLLILLAGFKELAFIRGYESVKYNVISASPEYVGTACQISWIPNYETGNRPISFEALADASFNNTSGFSRNYLAAIAENRAFVRCVRNSLGIHIVGYDEIDMRAKTRDVAKTFSPTEPHGVLQSVLEERKKSFPKFKEEWLSLGHDDARDWNSPGDIPTEQVYGILEAIKKLSDKR